MAVQFQIARKVKAKPVMDQIADGTGKKGSKADSRQARIGELAGELEGLERLRGGREWDEQDENHRALQKQEEDLQHELDSLRKART